jgi:hypothetical protein
MNIAGLRFHRLKGGERGRYAVDAAEIGVSLSLGTATTLPTSIWRIITDEQESFASRTEADAPR